MRRPLPAWELVDGEVTVVDLDARALVPGRIRGRVLREGEPVRTGAVSLVGEVSEGSWFSRRVYVDEEGWFVAEGVPPGRYGIRHVTVRGGSWFDAYAGSRIECVLRSGGEAESVFHVRTSRLHVRLVGADGESPAIDVMCHFSDGPTRMARFTDHEGRCVLDHAPGVLRVDAYLRTSILRRVFLGEVRSEGAERSVEWVVPSPLSRAR